MKKPQDGVFGIHWSRIPDHCLRSFVDQDHRLFERINEREISNLPMYLVGTLGESCRVRCMDFSPIGFRILGDENSPVPTPGDEWKLCVPSLSRGELEIPVRMVWAQKRASYPNWEAGLERRDILTSNEMHALFPKPSIALDYPGTGLMAYVEHPLLFQEWIRCEIVQLNHDGDILMATTDSLALAFGGDIQRLRLATPALKVKPHFLRIDELGIGDGSLFIRGKLNTWSNRDAKNMAMNLHQSGIVEAKALIKAGFDWSLHELQVDVQGLSMGIKTDRRVLGAFVDEKLVATLAYCLPEEKSGALFIEGLSLQTVALNRGMVHNRLFTLVARALLLSEQNRLEIIVDESQIHLLKRAGFVPLSENTSVPMRYVLTRQAIVWGKGHAFLPWLRGYHSMVEDLIEKGLYPRNWRLRFYLAATRSLIPIAKSLDFL